MGGPDCWMLRGALMSFTFQGNKDGGFNREEFAHTHTGGARHVCRMLHALSHRPPRARTALQTPVECMSSTLHDKCISVSKVIAPHHAALYFTLH